jgi:hypothetical protein
LPTFPTKKIMTFDESHDSQQCEDIACCEQSKGTIATMKKQYTWIKKNTTILRMIIIMFFVVKSNDTYTHNLRKGLLSLIRSTINQIGFQVWKQGWFTQKTLQTECCLIQHGISQATEKESTNKNMPAMDIAIVCYAWALIFCCCSTWVFSFPKDVLQ